MGWVFLTLDPLSYVNTRLSVVGEKKVTVPSLQAQPYGISRREEHTGLDEKFPAWGLWELFLAIFGRSPLEIVCLLTLPVWFSQGRLCECQKLSPDPCSPTQPSLGSFAPFYHGNQTLQAGVSHRAVLGEGVPAGYLVIFTPN